MRFLAFASLAALISASALQAASPTLAPDLSRLTDNHRAALRCAAAFAVVATEQASGDALDGWPPLAVRGKQFFADTGERITQEAAISREAVRDLIAAEVRALQTAADPDAALSALTKPCVVRLDAAVPPLVVPDLRRCAAILDLAYEDMHAREGLTPAARDLKTLASVLASREREALIAAGRSGDEADRIVSEGRDAMLAEAADGKGGIEKYDIAHCYDLAKPAEKSHY
ncbi:hypothetical protein [Novosphingobium sp. MMS21-SN21R]|uniref:hypothetical protein n=1 Tax=Novosphingobium sp. MMS21-SN21R TaxID=2969298 RepID=UPI002886F192|nr:hypothetical protein [Novosphingobium sp. MMS21-SN21R]MDT0506624.1 hypothetical protein [Novosphingobium sp. MMS21-SN21R]